VLATSAEVDDLVDTGEREVLFGACFVRFVKSTHILDFLLLFLTSTGFVDLQLCALC
jgi:hypothetical protein